MFGRLGRGKMKNIVAWFESPAGGSDWTVLIEMFCWFQRGFRPLLVPEKVERRVQKKGVWDVWQVRTGDKSRKLLPIRWCGCQGGHSHVVCSHVGGILHNDIDVYWSSERQLQGYGMLQQFLATMKDTSCWVQKQTHDRSLVFGLLRITMLQSTTSVSMA